MRRRIHVSYEEWQLTRSVAAAQTETVDERYDTCILLLI
jgi:hypothetical protein